MNNNGNRGVYPPQNHTYNSKQNSQPYNGQGQNPYPHQNQMQRQNSYPTQRQHTTLNSGERRPAMPRSGTPNQRPAQNGQYRGGQRPPNSPYGHQREMKQPISWIPIFIGLLVIMIAVGIICTVVNSRSRAANAGNSYQTDSTTDNINTGDIIGEDEGTQTPSGSKIAVTYASATSDTIQLGSSIMSDYAILIDLSTNTVKAQKNPDSTIFPASMTKIMTLIVAYENCKNFDETFTMTAEITDPLFLAGASVAGFSVGEEVTVRDLLYGAILPSGGDATDALAIHIAGSIEKFVDMMNRKVLQMGLSNTHFANPSGLHDDDHYSTPHEIALILQYALKIEECKKILCTYQYTTESTPQHPEGLLLTSTMFSRMAGNESGTATVLGGKTGYTNEGLHCLASLAKINSSGKEYVLVTAHAPATYDPVYDCINIYKELFAEE